MRHGVPLPSERSSTSPYTLSIGGIAPAFKVEVKIEVDFFSLASALGIFVPQSPESCIRKSEAATRRPAGLFFRENSSNGGKAIRTFWRNTKFGKIPCQGQISPPVSLWRGDSYRGY